MQNNKKSVEKVFRDPVHGYIHVQDQIIEELIDTKEFQRLRRIKQLGASSFTFPGAEHTRFTHSLGVYELTRQICDIFEREYPVETVEGGWDKDERLVTLCAALLHDIGHGPFSHTFEGIFNTDHEEFTAKIITSPETEVFQVLQQVGPEFPDNVASVIQKTYENPQVVQLISSQIDADRMDYLLRDSYYTGVSYGQFDITRILRIIQPYENGIMFKQSGMNAVEDYIMSRYQMYQQVYFHPASRGMEMVLKNLLKQAANVYKVSPDYFELTAPLLVPFLKGEYTLKDYLRLDDTVLTCYINMWQDHNDSNLRTLASRMLERKPLKSVKLDEVDDKEVVVASLKQHVRNIGFDENVYTALNPSYDLPYDIYRPTTKRTEIKIKTENNLVELSELSTLVKTLSGTRHGDERFYFPEEMLKFGYNLYSDDYEKFQEELEQIKKQQL